MQKTHTKMGLIIAMVCLFLAAGTFTSGTASAHTDQPSKRFHNWFVQAPHITVKLLSASGRHSKNAYAGRAVIYGVGFRANNGYGPCDSCGSPSTTPGITTTTTSTTTSTSTTTFSPTTTTCSSSCGSAPAGPSNQPGTTCPSACGNSTPVGPSTQPSTSTTCYSSCSTTPVGPSDQPGTTCPSDCGNSAPVGTSDQPGTTCPSDCGNSAPVGTSDQSSTTCYTTCDSPAPVGPSDQPGSDCGCNTVNIQSSAPISAYAPGTNLTHVPVNAFGEFRVIVNVQPPVRHYTMPTIWAVNTYNDQPSNYAPMCYCG